MGYDRVVSAALSETRSKFALAEALALDIPPRGQGRAQKDDSIRQHLEVARREIIEAGGEPRSPDTLDVYRRTALWATRKLNGTVQFQWVGGASWTAHREAYESGMSIEEFRGLPDQRVNTALRAAGKANKYPPVGTMTTWPGKQQIAAVKALPPERQAEIVEATLRDDRVRSQAFAIIRDAAYQNEAEQRAIQQDVRPMSPGVAASAALLRGMAPPHARALGHLERAYQDVKDAIREIRAAEMTSEEMKPLTRAREQLTESVAELNSVMYEGDFSGQGSPYTG